MAIKFLSGLDTLVLSSMLKTDANGVIVAAVAGTDYVVGSHTHSYLPLAGGTLTGTLTGTYGIFGNNVYVNQSANLTSQALQVNGFIDITDVTSTALRWYNGSTFKGGLGLDDWAHTGSASDITMYVSGDNSFHISTNNVKRVEVDSSGISVIGNITSTGGITVNNPASDKKIAFRRSTGKNVSMEHDASGLYFYNETDGTTMFRMWNAGSATIPGDLTVSGGDISLSGTGRIQGVDTVSAGTDAANKTYVDTSISNLVATAPSTLDTLNELAAALGDDANFSTTVTNSIATKLPLAGGTMTGITQFNDHTNYGDQVYARFGASQDLQIFHDGSHSYITNTGGETFIKNGDDLSIQDTDGTNRAIFQANAQKLYYNGSLKFETTSTGVAITGNLDSPQISVNDYISHNGDSNTYFGFPAADTINLTTAGAERMRITSAGYVGVGTTGPSSPLTVEYNNLVSNHTPAVFLKSKNSLNGSGDVLDVYSARGDGFTDGYIARFGNQASTKMYIRGDGNVGIGNSAPTTKLDVTGVITATGGNSTTWNTHTNDQTPAELLAAIKTVDGPGSGLNADALDGYNAEETAVNNSIAKRDGGGVITATSFNVNNTSTKIHEGGGNAIRLETGTGYIDIGSMNSSWIHFQGNKPYYFNQDCSFDAVVQPYANNAKTLGTSAKRWSTIYANGGDSTNWNTAYGWGDHGLSAQDKTDIGNLSGTNTGDQTTVSGNAGTVTNGVYTTGNQTIGGVKTFTSKIGADGGIDGLTLANGGITGSNFNIAGVNQLSINDPGEGIVFQGSTNVSLYAIDDATDSIMNFSNATEVRVNNSKIWTAANLTTLGQLSNSPGYTTNTGTTTASNTQTFTNKSGAISQWDNDSGYVTTDTNTQLSTAQVRAMISASGNSAYNATTGVITSTDTNTWRGLGTTASVGTAGNDARLSDARTPLTHTHSYLPATNFTRSGINSSTWTTVATVAGNNLSSVIKMTITGTSNSVVIAASFDITAQHHQDILVASTNGGYTNMSIKITSNGNEDFAIEAKHNGSTSTNCEIWIMPQAGESITSATSHSFTGTSYTHTAIEGYSLGGTDGGVTEGKASFGGVVTAAGGNSGQWNTAYGWGDHGLSAQDKTDIGNLSGTNTGDQTTVSGSSGSTTGNAATVTNGVYTTGNQTIGGTKTFDVVPVVGTAAAANNSTSAASTAYVTTAVTNLIGGAPGALDTLNELAAAIDDDASYAASVTAALGGKAPTSHTHSYLPLAGGTLTGSLVGAGTLSTPALSLNLTQASAGFNHMTNAFAPNVLAGGDVVHFIGQAGSTKNAASFGLAYAASGSNSNYITIGMWGADNLVNVFGNGNMAVGTTTDSGHKLNVNGTGKFVGTVTATTFSGALSGNASTATLAANSTLAGGLAINSTGTNNVANQIVRTQANGYIHAGWLNTPSGLATGNPVRIYCSQDNYIRYYSPAEFAPYILNQGSTKNSHTHSYLPLGGGTLTGNLVMSGGSVFEMASSTGFEMKFTGTTGASNIYAESTNLFVLAGTGKSLRMGSNNVNTELDLYDGNLTCKTNINPDATTTYDLGTDALRWWNIYCETLDSAGLHEKNLANKEVSELPTGTVLVWINGKAVPSINYADYMKIGIAVEGSTSPLVHGAEPVLCVGEVNEGDYLVSSNKEGHAVALTRQAVRDGELQDCVIGKALAAGNGDSHLVKTWLTI